MDFLEKGDKRPEIWQDVRNHQCCPAEGGLNCDSFECAGLGYGKEWIKAFGEIFGGFEAAGVVVQEANHKQNVKE